MNDLSRRSGPEIGDPAWGHLLDPAALTSHDIRHAALLKPEELRTFVTAARAA